MHSCLKRTGLLIRNFQHVYNTVNSSPPQDFSFAIYSLSPAGSSVRPLVRDYGIFQDVAKSIRGDVEKNPELKKKIEDLKGQADSFAGRARSVKEDIFSKVTSVSSDANAKVKESLENFRTVSSSVFQAKAEDLGSSSSVHQEVKSNQSQSEQESGTGSRMSFGANSNQESSQNQNEREKPEQTSESSGSTEDSKPSSQQSSGSGTTAGVKEAYSKAKRILCSTFKSTSEKVQAMKSIPLLQHVKTGYNFLSEELSRTTPPKKRQKMPKTTERSSITSVMLSRGPEPTAWEKRWQDLVNKARETPLFKKVSDAGRPVIEKSQELADDIRDRWETSDSPMVHRIQDMNESMFGETPSAIAMREIKRRDPEFTLLDFVQDLQSDVHSILLAYIKGDVGTLKKSCSNEVIERCKAEKRAYEAQGLFRDNKILHISDLEVRETKLVGNEPVIIVNFKTQQTYCSRDKHGNIVEGGRDEIHSVFYAWAMQLTNPEDHDDENEMYEPKWLLREMQQLGIQALI